ncbi:hypothetical protein PAPYR_19 [Paratrimastix pyriformis]|uniref:F-box domain-containing protein n=1 Tax=Paratrimastix pyriformis TaxID=342808 RepID=A0ABQ8UZN0_9EUKA|nr:hypothetical protein PAPYR_19 [Paratrimastix pyriformis]
MGRRPMIVPEVFLVPDLVAIILSRVERNSLSACFQTCRTWRNLARDSSFWRQRCLADHLIRDDESIPPLIFGGLNPWQCLWAFHINTQMKFIFIGTTRDGKSCLVRRYLGDENKPLPDSGSTTYSQKSVDLTSFVHLRYDFWELPPHYKRFAYPLLFRDVGAILIVYDPSLRGSFGKALARLADIRRDQQTGDIPSGVPFALISSNYDLPQDDGPPPDETIPRAYGPSVSLWESSAKTGLSLAEVFEDLTRRAMEARIQGWRERGLKAMEKANNHRSHCAVS